MMKRILLPGLLLLSALAVLSCEREMEAPSGNTGTSTASLDAATKTAYEGEKTFTWLAGDRIAVLADTGNSSVLVGFQTDTKAPSAVFTGELPAGAQLAGEAYYPETLASIGGDGEVILTFPSEFTPDPANPLSCVPMIGLAEEAGSYPFKTAGSILKLTVRGIPGDATGIRLSHVNETPILSGTFSVPANGTVTYRETITSANHVTAYFTPETAGETRSFYFPMAVQTIPPGMIVTLLRSGAGDLPIAVTAKSIELPRNTIVNVSAVASEQAYTSLYAYFPSTDVRSTLDPATGSFTWKAGDEIDVAASLGRDTWQGRRFVTTEEGSEVRFLLANEEETDSLALGNWAFYPSRTSEVAQDGGYNLLWDIRPNFYPEDLERYPDETQLITIDLPSVMALPEENPTRVLPLLGRREADLRYRFTPMTALLGVPVTDLPDDADFVTLSSETAALSGSFHLNTTVGTISQVDALSANPEGLTLTYSNLGDAATFWFPVPGGSFPDGLTLKVGNSNDPDGAMVVTVAEGLTLSSGDILTLPSVAFEPIDQQWTVVSDQVQFLDDFIWGRHSAYTNGTYVTVTLERSGLHPDKYRINNPYTVANAQFGYTPHTEGIVADPYLIFWLNDDGIVRFSRFCLGVEDSDTGGRPMMITHPLDWSSAKKGIHNKVVSALADGTPLEIELASIYSDPNDASYMYSRDGEGSSDASRIHILIPDETPETWNPVAEGEFIDNLLWPYHSWGTTRVPVVLEQNSKIPTKLRVANPYQTAATQFGYTPYTAGIESSEYMELTLLDNNLIRFSTTLAGIEDKASGGKPMKVWYPSDWGSSYDCSYNKVLTWRTDGLPAEIQLAAMYSDPVTVSYKYTKYNVPTIFFYFPEAEQPQPEEHWESVGTAQYRDKFINDSCPYVNTALEESDLGRYRLANPYPAIAAALGMSIEYEAGDYLYFTIADGGLINFETLVTGLKKDTWSLSISHPSLINKSVANNKVLEYDGDNPTVLQLAPIYHQTNAIESANKYSRDTYSDMIRILMPGAAIPEGVGTVALKQYPLLPDYDNPVEVLTLPAGTLEKLVVKISGLQNYSKVTGLRLWQGSGWMNADYVSSDTAGTVVMTEFANNATVSGDIDLNFRFSELPIGTPVTFTIQEAVVSGVSLEIRQKVIPHLSGRVVNNAKDQVTVRGDTTEVVASFRIPALVTTKKGTLIGAYDVRYDSSTDLQGDIDVGFKRSTDGGKTWSDLGLAMDLGIWGYETEVAAGTMTAKDAEKLNGIGDPCLLVDENTGDIFCFAVWAHGHGGTRTLSYASTGFEIDDTPQLLMVRSTDDGQTWSEPVNLTRQVKRYEWRMSFQGPGRGITMKDGTLVVPFQHQEGSVLNSGIMYSTDHGRTWHVRNNAHPTTSEAAVAEIEPGVLLLTMRDETNSRYRRNYVTSDLGRTWQAHASNGKLVEPTCEASLLHVDAADNGLGKDLLLFSNPNSSSGRNHMTIKASLDKGETWEYELLLDTGTSQYSCLTMIDKDTVGILYEGSKGNIFFQAVPLTAIVR